MNRKENFFDKSFDYRDYIFSPDGYEGIMLAFYCISIPYLVGIFFLFLFAAGASYDYFLQFELSSFFIIWAIGYEVSGGLIIAAILIAWLNHYIARRNAKIKGKNTNKSNRNRY